MPLQIQAKGVELSEKENYIIDKLFNEYDLKIQRELKDENVLIEIHIKVHDVSKRQKKFNVHVDVVNSVRFGATDDDWNLARAIHKVMNKIMSEIEHKFHVSNQGRKR